jgi:hypothetical protein
MTDPSQNDREIRLNLTDESGAKNLLSATMKIKKLLEETEKENDKKITNPNSSVEK